MIILAQFQLPALRLLQLKCFVTINWITGIISTIRSLIRLSLQRIPSSPLSTLQLPCLTAIATALGHPAAPREAHDLLYSISGVVEVVADGALLVGEGGAAEVGGL